MNIPTIRHEQMSDIFTKYHIEGLSFDAVIHQFTSPDIGQPHDHPYSFQSFILKGGYIEEVYTVDLVSGQWSMEEKWRTPGTSHNVNATDIHKIISLPDGECWTLILPGPWERKSGFWQFGHFLGIPQAKFREWDQPEFK